MIKEIVEVEYCKLNIHYETDPEVLLSKKEELITRFKNYNISGFRPGKANRDVVKMHFKKEIEQELKRELAEAAYADVITEKNIKPFGKPIFSAVNLENALIIVPGAPDQRFSCNFSLFKQPDFDLAQYKEFEIPKFSPQISAEELAQKIIQDIRVRYGDTVSYTENDFVQETDSVIIDCQGFLGEEELPELNVKGEMLTIGKTQVPNFDENILGMKQGEYKEFNVNVPEDFTNVKVAGKSVTFKVNVIIGSKTIPAALDDNLAKKLSLESFEKLTEQCGSMATTRVKELEEAHNFEQIARRLVSSHDFKIPAWISTAEAQMNIRNNGYDWNKMTDQEKEPVIKSSEDGVKLSLVLAKVRDQEPEAQLTDEEAFNIAQENILKHTQNSKEVFENIIKNNSLPLVLARVRDDATMEFIKKTCTFVE